MLLRRKFGEPIFFCARGQMEIVFRTKHSIAHSGAFYETKKEENRKTKKTQKTQKTKKKKKKKPNIFGRCWEKGTRVIEAT